MTVLLLVLLLLLVLAAQPHMCVGGDKVASAGGEFLFPGLGVSLSSDVTPTGSWCKGRCAGAYHTWKNLSLSLANFSNTSVSGPWVFRDLDLGFKAVISMPAAGQFDLTLTSTSHDMPQVVFPLLDGTPMDNRPNLVALFPLLGGIFVQAGSDCYGNCEDSFVMDYPGQFHSPYAMLCTKQSCLMAAATTWPPHHVRPKRRITKGSPTAKEPMRIEWVDGYISGPETKLSIMLTEFQTDEQSRIEAWQKAVLAYKSWLRPNRPAAPPAQTSGKMSQSEGMWAVGLQNVCNPPRCSFNLSALDAQWTEWKDVLGRVQFWGQMSNYGGDPTQAMPPLLPGEQVGCCLRNRTMHPRYRDAGLPAWARKVASEGYEVGYYTRTLGADVENRLVANVSWFATWLDNMKELGGNAQYVDQFARTVNGPPNEVLKLVEKGIPPADVVTEGWNDLYPFAGLLSGFHQGDDWCACSDNTTIYDMDPWGDRPSGSFIRLVRLVMGDALGYFGYQDGELARWGDTHDWFSERQAFMLGAKLDAGYRLCGKYTQPADCFLRRIHKLRSSLNWWTRNFSYLDTIGIGNEYTGLIDVRRFDDDDNATVLLVDNFRNISGLSVSFGGRTYSVASTMISAIQVKS